MNGRDDTNTIAPSQMEAGYGSTRASCTSSAPTSSIRDAQSSSNENLQRHTNIWIESSSPRQPLVHENPIAPSQMEAGYGSTRASYTSSAPTSSIRDAQSNSNGNLQRHTNIWTESSSPRQPLHEHVLERHNSSSTVRINAVDDNTSNLRSSELPGVIDMHMLGFGLWALLRHWGDEDKKIDPLTSHDESCARAWRRWLVVTVVVKALLTVVCMVRWRLQEEDDGTRSEIFKRRLRGAYEFLGFAKFCWAFTGLQMLLESQSWDNRSDWVVYQAAEVLVFVDLLPVILMLMVALALCFFLPCMLVLLRGLPQRWQEGVRQDEIDSIPVVKYSEAEGLEEGSCAVCLLDYEAEDELRILPCKHAFHKLCVDRWLAINWRCPICRALRSRRPDVGETADTPRVGEDSV